MKKIMSTALLIGSMLMVQAQKKAVTEEGEEVILYDNGTWKFQNEERSNKTDSDKKLKSFKKNEKSTFLIKSKKTKMGFWIDPKLWSFAKAKNNEDAEFELNLKSGDLYAMIISEKIEIPLENLKSIAFETAKGAAPDITIVKEEYRMVNNLKVLLLQMNGTIQGIKFSYYGYYYSNENGTVQFITYTSQNLLNSNMNACEDLLNGMVLLN